MRVAKINYWLNTCNFPAYQSPFYMANYLHGFIPEEQQRLIDQAGFLAPKIFKKIDFSGCEHLLEIGSGVGAQTQALLSLFPQLKITCVDYSDSQIEKAKENLKGFEDRVTFSVQDAMELNLDQTFDSAYICWVLEHIAEPRIVLEKVHRHLKPGAKVFLTEVFNSTHYTFPALPFAQKYYRAYNDFQTQIGGHPEIGASLGNLLQQSGFTQISHWLGGFHLDQTHPEELKAMISFWVKLMKSGAEHLIQAGLVTEEEVRKMEEEYHMLPENENAVFFIQFVQAFASV
ncbi:hypothetical protein Ataiwa_38830 [Algoriphagus taiwanensis]|uniref:Methyltransferase type 12 domain-containing protein n=2 Tax=Algoriphagus taiwanensis TaxID=1445656 RepID=A0ABQ6Q7G4_9BACT|nr:hypothetical protein Ataiwa_38830 [Algoriphagus taiwanensis]